MERSFLLYEMNDIVTLSDLPRSDQIELAQYFNSKEFCDAVRHKFTTYSADSDSYLSKEAVKLLIAQFVNDISSYLQQIYSKTNNSNAPITISSGDITLVTSKFCDKSGNMYYEGFVEYIKSTMIYFSYLELLSSTNNNINNIPLTKHTNNNIPLTIPTNNDTIQQNNSYSINNTIDTSVTGDKERVLMIISIINKSKLTVKNQLILKEVFNSLSFKNDCKKWYNLLLTISKDDSENNLNTLNINSFCSLIQSFRIDNYMELFICKKITKLIGNAKLLVTISDCCNLFDELELKKNSNNVNINAFNLVFHSLYAEKYFISQELFEHLFSLSEKNYSERFLLIDFPGDIEITDLPKNALIHLFQHFSSSKFSNDLNNLFYLLSCNSTTVNLNKLDFLGEIMSDSLFSRFSILRLNISYLKLHYYNSLLAKIGLFLINASELRVLDIYTFSLLMKFHLLNTCFLDCQIDYFSSQNSVELLFELSNSLINSLTALVHTLHLKDASPTTAKFQSRISSIRSPATKNLEEFSNICQKNIDKLNSSTLFRPKSHKITYRRKSLLSRITTNCNSFNAFNPCVSTSTKAEYISDDKIENISPIDFSANLNRWFVESR